MKTLSAWLAVKLIFFPTKMVEFHPTQWELVFEDVFFKNEEGLVLHGWFFPGGPPNRTLIFFHGNAGNIGDRLPKLKKLQGIGMNLFIFDYRGYGGSEGRPSLDGVIADSRAAYDYVLSRPEVDPNHIILYGESLGGAMAVQVAKDVKYSALILESTFTSVRDMARSAYPFVPGFLAPDVYRSSEMIRTLHEPILILHGTKDAVVPYAMGEQLYHAAPQPKRFVSFPGADHNNIHEVAGTQYLQAIEDFFVSAGQ